MAKPKRKGGLGFKDITSFNDAMLAKIGWRLLQNPACLLARCLLGKYCHSDSFLGCKVAPSSSHGWRNVLVGRDLLSKQLGWMVGTGESTNAWNDPWLSHCEQLRPYGPSPKSLQSLKVLDLIQTGTYEWEMEKNRAYFAFP